MSRSKKALVLISASGTNLQALIDTQPVHGVTICAVMSNRGDAYGLKRAEQVGINAHFYSQKRAVYERELLALIESTGCDIILLAGFMRVLGREFLAQCPCPILNIHPSLLPAYKGLDTHARVLASGDNRHGCSVHAVNDELDSGQLIAQSVVTVKPNQNGEQLQRQVQRLEHWLYPEVLSWYGSGKLSFNGSWYLSGKLLKQPIRFYADPL